jgi:aminotransferase
MIPDVNRLLSQIPASYIRALNDRRRPTSLNLGLGEPNLKPDGDLVEDGLRRFREGLQGYTTNAGLPELRAGVVAHRPDLNITPDQVMVTIGTMEAVFCSLGALVNPGDDVLVVEPAFAIYGPISTLFGANPVPVAMDPDTGFALDAARVRAAMTPRTKAICVVSPCNPSGRALDEKQARALADLADESGATLVVDEVYRELHHTEAPAPSPGAYTRRVVTLGGLSKSCAMTGMRIGWMILPPFLYTNALKLHQLAAVCASSLCQHIAVSAFQNKALFRHRPLYTARLDPTLELVERLLGKRPVRPEGAFYVFMDLRHLGVDTMVLCNRLLDEEDVVMIPGEAFGQCSAGFIRIAIAQDLDVVKEGLQRLGRQLARMGYKTGA